MSLRRVRSVAPPGLTVPGVAARWRHLSQGRQQNGPKADGPWTECTEQRQQQFLCETDQAVVTGGHACASLLKESRRPFWCTLSIWRSLPAPRRLKRRIGKLWERRWRKRVSKRRRSGRRKRRRRRRRRWRRRRWALPFWSD